MKTSHTLYSRLSLITCITLVTGYIFVYAVGYITILPGEYASGQPLTSTLFGKVIDNITDLNTRVNSLASGWGSLWGTGASNSINYTAGTVGIGSTAGTNAELQIKSGTKPHWGVYQDETTEELRFWNGSNRVVFGSGGNMGIGTTSPNAYLHLKGINIASRWQLTLEGTDFTQMTFYKDATTRSMSFYQNQADGSLVLSNAINNGNISNIISGAWNFFIQWGNGLVATINGSAPANSFYVNSSGNVGIGTPNPGAKLDIKMNTVGTYFRGTASTDGGRGLSITSSDNGIYLGAIHNFDIASAAGIYAFSINSAEKVRINGDGNVGIGTTSTPGRLTVFANPQTTTPIYITTSDDNNGATKNPLDWNYAPGIIIWNNWSGNAATVNSTKIAKIVLNTAAGGYNNGASIHVEGAGGYDQGQLIFSTGWNSSSLATERMRINASGYVGIWVPGPTYRLQLPNTASAAWQWQANAWVTYSDGRVKTNKETLKYGISEIMKMDPKQYIHHSSEFQSGSLVVTSEWMHTIGFIAQELEKIIPEAVNKPKDDSKELWSVDYNKIVPILVNAMKELKKENDSLKSRLDALEQR